MELVHILKSLWRKRALVAAGALLAALVATTLLFRVSLSPPGLHAKVARQGAASTEIMIDAQQSALGDLRRATDPLVARTGLFARFLGAGGATDAIAHASGLPANDIAIAGPILRVDGVPEPATAARAFGHSGKPAAYVVQVQQGDTLPLLTIYTQAPTADAAGRLANGTATGLQAFLTSYQDRLGIPPERRVDVRQLGVARATAVEIKPGLFKPVAAFCVLFGLWCFALLAGASVRAAWRAPETQHEPHPVESLEIWLNAVERTAAHAGAAGPGESLENGDARAAGPGNSARRH